MENSFFAGGYKQLRKGIRQAVEEEIRAEFADELTLIRRTKLWRYSWFRSAVEVALDKELARRADHEVEQRMKALVSPDTLY